MKLVSFLIFMLAVLSSNAQLSFGFTYRMLLEGVEVIKILKNSPAEKAGLKPGDIITLINDTPLRNLSNEKKTEALVNAPVKSVFVIAEFSGDEYGDVYRKGTVTIIKEDKAAFLNKCLAGDCVNGRGTWLDIDGGEYTGRFINGKKEGTGKWVSVDGTEYNGEWKAGKKEGKGKAAYYGWGILYKYRNWSYNGDWSNDKRNGKGTLVFGDGSMYNGDWKNDMREGPGKYIFRDSIVYEGEWKNDFLNGKGTIVFKNGDTHTGNFVDSNLEGEVLVYTKLTNVTTTVIYKKGVRQ